MGGTNIRCAAVSVTGDVLLMEHGPSLASRKAGDVAENIAAQTLHLLDTARRRGLGSPRAIGVAVPGPLDVHTGTVMQAPHVAAWRGYPLRDKLEALIGRKVVVDNDANAWALGEYWRGAARGRRDVVLLTLGTGVGGGLIVGGKLVHGRSGMAGELGHVTVNPDGPPCDCGSHGCLESYASASGLRGLGRDSASACRRGRHCHRKSSILKTISRCEDCPPRLAVATSSRSKPSRPPVITWESRSRRFSISSIPSWS